MQNLINRSKRGYAYQVDGHSFPKKDEIFTFSPEFMYDPEIEAIWEKYRGLIGNETPIELVLLLVDRLKRLMGADFSYWLWIQVSANRAVQGYALDFLKDSLSFVETGVRSMSIDVWYSLVDKDPAMGEIDKIKRAEEFKTLYIPSIEDLLSKWLAQKDGVRDLFQSAQLLFGNTK